MGKIKNALISWNQDNGYPADVTSGWGRRKIDGPKMSDLIKQQKKDRESINKIKERIDGNKI